METGYVATQGGIRLYFQKIGEGPQTVLVPNGIHLFEDFKLLADGRTLIFYDVRNRGRSDSVSDASLLRAGIHNDVDDMETVRRYFDKSQINLIGHSYMGLMVALYAMKYPANVGRLVQIGAVGPEPKKEFLPPLSNKDATLAEVFSRLAQLQRDPRSESPEEACRRFWALMKPIFVANPADADKIHWDRCDLPNERKFMSYWTEFLLPSIEGLDLTSADLGKVQAPALIVHGTMDRRTPYGGGREWALKLPNARLVTVEKAAHAPWIENPDRVFGSIKAFLNGAWPETAEKIAD